MKFDKLLFSAFANATNFAFRLPSILKEMVVSFIAQADITP